MIEAVLNSWIVHSVILPFIGVAILAFLFYQGYLILIQTRAVQIIKGSFFLVALYGFAYFLNLKTLLTVLNLMVPGLVIAIAIIFQPELRKIFTRLGQGTIFRFRGSSGGFKIDEIIKAATMLSEIRRGALIVFVRSVGLKNIAETGTPIDAEISASLLTTIFSFDTPLHDGAVIIENSRITVAGALLPLSEQQDIRKSFGTRHRAALGVVEDSDAVALVVSEETGAISIAYESLLYYNLDSAEVEEKLVSLLRLEASSQKSRLVELRND
jgi:diadenylate cyclase